MTQFRKRTGLTQLRNYTGRRRGSLLAAAHRDRMPQLGAQRSAPSGYALAWTLVGAAVVVLVLIVAAPLWLPMLSWIIPDRYIMAYAPAGVQELIFQIDPEEQLPTAVATNQNLDQLLAELAPTPTITLTPPPPSYIQPTRVAIAPTPTYTPVFSVPVDASAVDRENEADLSDAVALLQGFNWEQQGYNNCGPASIRVLMSYWGHDFTEAEAAAFLKPNPEDPNVRPDEIADYVEQVTDNEYTALIRVNGDFDVIQKFILAGYPVLIETGYDPEPDKVGWTSHYLTIVGYSPDSFIAMDTYRRPNWKYSYSELDYYWRQFNRRYVIIHRADQAAAVASIIGEDMDDATMYANSLYVARAESSLDRQDPYAWFNIGSTLVAMERYEDAALAFDEARRLGLPSRFLWYQFGPYEAYLQVGRYDDVIELADFVLGKKASEEAFYYKGLALAAQGEIDQARVQIGLAVRHNRNFDLAQQALDELDE